MIIQRKATNMQGHLISHFIVALAAMSLSVAAMSAKAADPIDERSNGYKTSKDSIAAIKYALATGEPVAITAPARSLAAFATTIPSLYPPGSNGFFSRASGDIWRNWSDFEAKARTFQNSASALAELASTNAGPLLLNDAFDKLQASCKSCHDAYRRGFF
jgi:cytochrome c556